MPGPSKQPKKVSQLRGTHQPCREPDEHLELESLTDVPPPPDWLSGGEAISSWKKYAPCLVGAGLLSEIDLNYLAMFCSIEGKMIQLRQAGEMPHASMITQYNNYAAQFAIGPQNRQKFKMPAGDKEGNKFAARKKK